MAGFSLRDTLRIVGTTGKVTSWRNGGEGKEELRDQREGGREGRKGEWGGRKGGRKGRKEQEGGRERKERG